MSIIIYQVSKIVLQVLYSPEIIKFFNSLKLPYVLLTVLLNMQYFNFFFFINSASCRRPIKGAASRPLEHSDFILEESYSKYAQKYGTSTDIKSEKPPIKKERPVSLWIKVLLFVAVSLFMFLVYQSMETNQGNPFSRYLKMVTPGSAE